MTQTFEFRRLVYLIAFIMIAGCASVPDRSGLEPGIWELQTTDGNTTYVTVSELRVGEYYFDAGTHPVSGVYTLQAQRVVMKKPDNPRMKEYVWRLRSDRSLVLVEETPVELSGERLIASTLVGPI
jgi:hypothetical protein